MSEQPTRFPDDLRETEKLLVRDRRQQAGLAAAAATAPIAGLALSGGGIRSATFNLGVLQALAGRGLLRRFDYLSTVSGGGYIGSFFGAWVHRRGIDEAEKGLAGMDGQDPASLPVRYLRENGRYLTPNGSTDAWLAACMQVRNQFTILFLLLLPVIGTMFGAEAIKAWLGVLPEQVQATTNVVSVLWPLVASFALVTLLPLASGYWFVGAARDGKFPYVSTTLCVLWAVGLAFSAWAVGSLLASFGPWWPETASLDGVRHWGRQVREWNWLAIGKWTTLTALCAGMVMAIGLAAVTRPRDLAKRRRQYTNWLGSWAAVVALAALFAAIDTVAQWFAREVQTLSRATAGPVTLAVVVAVAQRLGPWLSGLGEGSRLKLSQQALSWLAATVVAAAIVIGFAASVHLVAINRIVPMTDGGRLMPALAMLGIAAACWALAWLCGRDFRFVNTSSMHRLYSSRLARAYVGATNELRTGGGSKNFDATDVQSGDDIAWNEYRPDLRGGPLHLVNVTVNETVSGQSNVDKEDRRGLGMAIGPVSLSTGPRASIKAPQRAVGELTLGEWVGVSGAAFTTGMGANTSLPLSFLLGLLNVRLGFWWNSRDAFRRAGEPTVYPGQPKRRKNFVDYSRRAFPAQSALIEELTARLHGPTQPYWYLSDGGHFENSACYEYLRRQVPLIVCCDCGADDTYNFEDIANLVRKARIDFGAEITFLDSDKAAVFSPGLGSLDDLKTSMRADGTSLSTKHGAVARVKYADGTYSVLVVIKPTLSADLPIDILQYDSKQREFPQQSTIDQFFDEAQWESYRKLGRFIGEKLFAEGPTPGRIPLWEQLSEYARTGVESSAPTGPGFAAASAAATAAAASAAARKAN